MSGKLKPKPRNINKSERRESMQLIIVRHGDPNYAIDSLTKEGKKEAKLLAKRLEKEKIDYFYCSPLGRAKKTASYTLKLVSKKAETLDWLREFEGRVKTSPIKPPEQCWDRLPSYWTETDDYYGENWYNTDLMKTANVRQEYERVCNCLDGLLKKHGYVHEGRHFRVERSNHDKIVLFCHFGVECVILSHLIGVSPMILWHNFVALPTSVTTAITEEREKGIAVFRVNAFGDTSHLYAGNQPVSFAARFCECFDDDTRH